MKLTTDQEKLIENFVDAQGLKIKTLRDDIIDHLCCVVESELGTDRPFQQVLDKAIAELAPKGLIEIQHKTIFLLTSKRILIMKKLMYFIGFLGAFALTAGTTFKLLNMPWANELFSTGLLTVLLIFIPLLAIDRYKVAISKALTEKAKIILGLAAAIVTGMSVVFKLLHLQGAGFLLMLGAFIFAIGFLPFFFFRMYKKSLT